jgi:hypothetical protein
LGKRTYYSIVSLILPVLLPLRIVKAIVGKGRHIPELVYSMPLIIALMSVWSFGELCGYVFGEGDSENKWQ